MSTEAKTPIIGTGLSGLVGSKLVDLYKDHYMFQNLDISHPTQPVDITDQSQVLTAIADSTAEFVIHMAAFTDVTAAWQQSDEKSGLCYQINVVGTQNVALACKAAHKHMIHISTAYVFDGNKPTSYVETDARTPIEWYGKTKALAEEIVEQLPTPWTILRIDQPFRSDNFARPDVVGRIINQLQAHTLPPQFTDHSFGPTYIDDLAKVINWVMKNNMTGIFHASNGESWTDFDFSHKIDQLLGLEEQILTGRLSDYLRTSNRPYQKNTALDISKLQQLLDFDLTPIEVALTQRLAGH